MCLVGRTKRQDPFAIHIHADSLVLSNDFTDMINAII